MHIKPDKLRLFGQLFFIFLNLSLLIIFPSIIIGAPSNGIKVFYFLLSLLSVIAILYAVSQMMVFPIGADIDGEQSLIKFQFLFKKSISLNREDIDSYSFLTGMRSGYGGISVNLNNSQKILCSSFTLSEYQPIIDFLSEINIRSKGTEKYKFLNFFKLTKDFH